MIIKTTLKISLPEGEETLSQEDINHILRTLQVKKDFTARLSQGRTARLTFFQPKLNDVRKSIHRALKVTQND